MTETPSNYYIRVCLESAAEAERLALHELKPVAKAKLLELASRWREAAADNQYGEKLERLLKVRKAPKGQSKNGRTVVLDRARGTAGKRAG
jgi:hypothetical protein